MSGTTVDAEPFSQRYFVRLVVMFGRDVEMEPVSDQISQWVGENYIVNIRPESVSPQDAAASMKSIRVDLHGFSDLTEAERMANRLVFSVLWFAVTYRISVQLQKQEGGLTWTVRDSLSGGGAVEVKGYVRVFARKSWEDFNTCVEGVLLGSSQLKENELIALDIYASAGFERTPTSTFIRLIMALEALSPQVSYGNEIDGLIRSLANVVDSYPLSSDDRSEQIRRSLSGSVRKLIQQSAISAIRDMLRQHGFDDKTVKFVKDAYDTRSALLHTGTQSRDLSEDIDRLREILRRVFSSLTSTSLIHPNFIVHQEPR